jgi:hypothetical protein
MPPRPLPSKYWAAVTLVAAIAAAVIILVVRPELGGRGVEANERQVVADLERFATLEDNMVQLVFGRVKPEVLANPRERIPFLRTSELRLPIEPRFLTPERHGYRFTFEGTPHTLTFDPPADDTYDQVTYVATPLEPGRTGRRSFAYYSRAGHKIFSRTDGRLPTPDDPVVHSWPE